MMQMANAASTQGMEIGKAKLRDFLENHEGARGALGMPPKHAQAHRADTGISMDTLDSNGKRKPTGLEAEDDI